MRRATTFAFEYPTIISEINNPKGYYIWTKEGRMIYSGTLSVSSMIELLYSDTNLIGRNFFTEGYLHE